MSTELPLDESLFNRAAEIESTAEREAFLDQACHGNAQLRERVAALLAAHNQPDDLMDRVIRDAIVNLPPAFIPEHPGMVIGAYKLLQKIGEGGMGVVFMAAQTDPICRRVALKVIKPGMDTRQVIARFEAERQALALMDHPNIAKVFDGGVTESGRPYFVMELIKGRPITEFCDTHCFTPRERLALFISVCHAVQHAHQKAIIHRDLKPSNILVSMHDDTPVVKVIDFGVAKALGQNLTDKTLFTRFAEMIGTTLHMAPEQTGESDLDADTRSDIYTLGVLLYELLTGTTPFDKERLEKVGEAEIRRIICKEDPPKPSTRLSESGEALSSVSTHRNMEPVGLTRLVKGDLDKIVMMTLEKDRNRRYQTAGALADDVQNYLDDKPIVARDPSVAYRLYKFYKRNRVLVTATAASMLVALACLAVSWVQINQALKAAQRERDIANDRANRFLQGLTEPLKIIADPGVKNADDFASLRKKVVDEACLAYEDYMEKNGLDVDFLIHIGLLRTASGEHDRALDSYTKAVAHANHLVTERRGDARAWAALGQTEAHLGLDLWVSGRTELTAPHFRTSATAFQRSLELDPHDRMAVQQAAWFTVFVPDPAIRDPKLALALATRLDGMTPRSDGNRRHFASGLRTLVTLCLAEYRAGNIAAARRAMNDLVEIRKGETDRKNPNLDLGAYEMFLLALLDAYEKDPQAGAHFDAADSYMRHNRYGDFELHMLRDEVADILELPHETFPWGRQASRPNGQTVAL